MNSYLKDGTALINKVLHSSFDLPNREIIDELPEVQKVTGGLALRILNNVQKIIDNQNGKGNILDTTEKKTLEEKFNILVEINDRILDRCNTAIYSIEHPDATQINNFSVIPNPGLNNDEKSDAKKTPKDILQMISSKNIDKPQLKFNKGPDNTEMPFRPILTVKPNAKVSLEASLVQNSADDHNKYPHPYASELNSFEIPNQQYNPETPIPPKSLDDTPYQFVKTKTQLLDMIAKLKCVNEFAVDLEHHSQRSYLGITCLIQISTRDEDFIIDTLDLHDEMEVLNEVFTDPKILKVFHGCNSDVMWLQRDFGVYLINLFDTGVACQLLELPRKSLSFLLEKYCNVSANKEYRVADWRYRPLPSELIEYARTDTHYLLYIYDELRMELSKRNLLSKLYYDCKALSTLLYQKPMLNENEHLNFYQKSSENFTSRQMYALKRLLQLRDTIARNEDESPNFVLQNRVLLNIAQVLPREASGVLACCGQDKKLPLLLKYRFDFQKICLEAYNEKIEATTIKVKDSNPTFKYYLKTHDRIDSEATAIKLDTSRPVLYENQSSNLFTSVPHFTNSLKPIVKEYLKFMPLETYKDIQIRKQKELDAEKQREKALNRTSTKSKRPVVEIEIPEDPQPGPSTPKQNTSNDSEQAKERKKMKTVNNVVTFNYQDYMNEMRQKFCKRSAQSDKNPYNAKRFKMNKK